MSTNFNRQWKTTALFFLSGVMASTGAFSDDATVICDTMQHFQDSLTSCSISGDNCVIQSGTICAASGPLYMWGNASLTSSNGGGITFSQTTPNRYLLNLGISGAQVPGTPTSNLASAFTGKISGVTFAYAGANFLPADGGGRTIALWRTNGAVIDNNVFNLGGYRYSATFSGNDNNWVINGDINSVRQYLTISNNVVNATQIDTGFEGISIGAFEHATIIGNTVTGVGDDPIAVHYSRYIKILRNVASSVDGRIFVSNTRDVEIAYNHHSRMASLANNNFYTGTALLFVGPESFKLAADNTTPYYAPDNVDVHDNVLRYPVGTIDNGAAMYFYGPRHTSVKNNVIVNDSTLAPSSLVLAGIFVLPAYISKGGVANGWTDPLGTDTGGNALVHDITLDGNVSTGKVPLSVISNANLCTDIVGTLNVTNNIATPAGTTVSGANGYQFNCTSTSHGTGNMSHAVSPVSNF